MQISILDLTEDQFDAVSSLLTQTQQMPFDQNNLTRPKHAEIWRPRIAILQDGTLIGSSFLQQSESDLGSHGFTHIDVSPDHQRQGIGTKLFQDLIEHARSVGLTYLHGNILDDRPGALPFADKTEFTTKRQTYHSELNINAFDESQFADTVVHHQAEGIQLSSFAEMGDSLENKRKLYELNKICSADIPGRGPFFSFEAFCAWRFDRPVYRKAGVIVATAGDEWVGFSIGTYHEAGNFVFNQMTGVIREFRGKGLSIPLKLLVTQFAKNTPADRILTFNDTENRPMLRINEILGYQRTRTAHWIERSI